MRLVLTLNPSPPSVPSSTDTYLTKKPKTVRGCSSGHGSADIVSQDDLKSLIDNLDEKADEVWENVIEKSNTHMTYKEKCSNPKNCTPVTLRDFYMDNDFKKKWDMTMINHGHRNLGAKVVVYIWKKLSSKQS